MKWNEWMNKLSKVMKWIGEYRVVSNDKYRRNEWMNKKWWVVKNIEDCIIDWIVVVEDSRKSKDNK